MASSNTINVRVTTDTDTSGIDKTSDSLKKFQGVSETSNSKVSQLKDSFVPFAAITYQSGQALDKITSFMSDSVSSANKLQGALSGLSSVSKGMNINVNAANKAAQDLASDGLMTVSDSAESLKNLLSSGFSLPDAIKLLKGLKDQASYNRQSFYDMGGAVKATTEGIKNGNSVLADATGTTKNLSVMAKEAGISQDKMGSIAQDAGYRQSVLNGFLKDTSRSTGDAAKYAQSAAGKQAEMSAQTEILKQKIGLSLQPALLELLKVITPVIKEFAQFTTDHPQLVAATLIIGGAVTGLVVLLAGLGTAIGAIAPIWTLMASTGTAAIGGLSGTFVAFKALVSAPMVMGAIGIAAAFVAFQMVQDKAKETRAVIEDTQRAADNAAKSNQAVIQNLNNLIKNGTPDQKARAKTAMANLAANGSFATGGYTGQGGMNEVAGVVHKGEYVVPKSQVDQSTGQPKAVGSTYNIQQVVLSTSDAVQEFFNIDNRNGQLASQGLSTRRYA